MVARRRQGGRKVSGGKVMARWWQGDGQVMARWQGAANVVTRRRLSMARWWQGGGKGVARWWQGYGKVVARRQSDGKVIAW